MNIFKAIIVEAERVGGVLASIVARVEAIEAFLEAETKPAPSTENAGEGGGQS